MNKKITSLCDLTVKNYRKVKEELRYDGEYINHFASLVYFDYEEDIQTSRVKKLRTYIKEKTSRMSCFRGDILYMISFLIVDEKDKEYFIDEIISTYELLIESGFKESQYLVLTSYVLVKYGQKENRFFDISNIKEIFSLIKERYDNVTNEEDYLECALLTLTNVNNDKVVDNIDVVVNSLSELDMFSKNSVQGLAMAILLNKSAFDLYNINELLIEFERRDMKISHQFLPLLGIINHNKSAKEYVDEVNEVIKYLCEEEALYEFYMDKSFRTFIAIAIIELSKKDKKERYVKELLSVCVYSFLLSKNQGVFSEILA